MIQFPTRTKKTPVLCSAEDRHAVKELYRMMFEKTCEDHPNTEIRLLAKPKPFQLTKTNDIERAICKWFALHGYNAERVKTQGRKIGTDTAYFNQITGKVQIVEKAKYIPPSGMLGSADISATCKDKQGAVMSLRIEVKNRYTNDRVRPDQDEYKKKHEAAGGTYVIIRTFSEFVDWYNVNVL